MKEHRITHLRLEGIEGLDPNYAGWFARFNEGLFYEAHDVLESLWLRQRHSPDDHFYKGLIQLAGAFVHLQKSRLRPADALFRLADANLSAYLPRHHHLDVVQVRELIAAWRQSLERHAFTVNPLGTSPAPHVLPDLPGAEDGPLNGDRRRAVPPP